MNMESTNFSYPMHFGTNLYNDVNMFGGYFDVNQMYNWVPSAEIQLPPQQYFYQPHSYQYATSTGESSVASSLASPYSEISPSPQPNRNGRHRTSYTPSQLLELHAEFQIDHYLTKARQIQIAERLSMSEQQVKKWFQNKRMKEKKKAEERESRLESSMENSPPSSSGPLAPLQQAPQYDEIPVTESLVRPVISIFTKEDYNILGNIAVELAQNLPNIS